MAVKSQLQRSISDLEQTIKHDVLNHENVATGAWTELNHLLQSEVSLSVYCDCSVMNGCFHLGICVVGLGNYRLYGGASIATDLPQHNILGELHALQFAIGCTRDFLAVYGVGGVRSVYVFSDVDHIEQLLLTNSKHAHESIRKSVRRLRRTLKRFNMQFTQSTLSVRYIGNSHDRNLYYRSTHWAARKVGKLSQPLVIQD